MSRLLLVGWDAADWKVINPLLDAGRMPVLAGLVERGVMGDLKTLQPPLSPLLWNSIATGKRADRHGILGFHEVDEESGQIRASSSTSRQTKALWNILSQRGFRTHVIGWLGSHPAEPINGVCVSDLFPNPTAAPGDPWPLHPGTVHPARLEETLGVFRVAPDEIDESLLLSFVPRAAEVDQENDRLLAILARDLAEAMSIQSAATWTLANEPWDFAAVFFLSLDHFSHAFMPFHPPRLPQIPEKKFDLYRDVVTTAYRFHDMMLGELIRLAGPDAHVMLISDHGFHSDHLRPRETPAIPSGPTIWHRPHGVFCLAGPGIRKDDRIYGAGLLDIAPTVLHLLGLPAGADMEGRVLGEVFEEAIEPKTIPSWDLVEGNSGFQTGYRSLSREESDALLEHFVALGYIDRAGQDLDANAKAVRLEQNWNLARVLLDKQEWERAWNLLRSVHAEAPARSDIAVLLAQCQLQLGLLDEAERTIESVAEKIGSRVTVLFIRGLIALARGRDAEGIQCLESAALAEASLPAVYVKRGFALLNLRLLAEAQSAFAKAGELDPHDPMPLLGKAIIAQRQRRYDESCDAALRAIGLDFQLPRPHYVLGVSLAALRVFDRAASAFETSLRFHGASWRAHGWLSWLYRRRLNNPEKADFHRARWREGEAKRRQTAGTLRDIRGRAGNPELPVPTATASVPSSSEPLLIVSGLPRSGTSLMMQILAAGGLPSMDDGLRVADMDNPRGYFEWEAIRNVGQYPDILDQAAGKAVKVVSTLIPALPKNHSFRVLFMSRPIEEIFASQQKMLHHRQAKPPGDPERLKESLRTHLQAVLQGMQTSARFEVLCVDYGSLVSDPESWLPRIRDFVGPDRLPNVLAMRACVRPALHRNRQELH